MFKYILLIFLVSITPTFANKISKKPKCEQKVCYLLFKPVCGINCDGEEKTFSNSCFLSIDCSDPPYEFLHDGACKADCNIQVCEKIYKPICAEKPDGEQLTFSNLCDFENRNCLEFQNEYSFLKDGKCCGEKCPKIYEAVCAENLAGVRRTFTSQCELIFLICNENSDFKYLMDGPCCAARCSIADKKPVCAINSKGETKIFEGECDVGAWNCSQGTDYEITSFKKCKKCKVVKPPEISATTSKPTRPAKPTPT